MAAFFRGAGAAAGGRSGGSGELAPIAEDADSTLFNRPPPPERLYRLYLKPRQPTSSEGSGGAAAGAAASAVSTAAAAAAAAAAADLDTPTPSELAVDICKACRPLFARTYLVMDTPSLPRDVLPPGLRGVPALQELNTGALYQGTRAIEKLRALAEFYAAEEEAAAAQRGGGSGGHRAVRPRTRRGGGGNAPIFPRVLDVAE